MLLVPSRHLTPIVVACYWHLLTLLVQASFAPSLLCQSRFPPSFSFHAKFRPLSTPQAHLCGPPVHLSRYETLLCLAWPTLRSHDVVRPRFHATTKPVWSTRGHAAQPALALCSSTRHCTWPP